MMDKSAYLKEIREQFHADADGYVDALTEASICRRSTAPALPLTPPPRSLTSRESMNYRASRIFADVDVEAMARDHAKYR